MRFLLASLLSLVACGTTPDERPATVEVVALSILAPTCGQVQCHSATSKIQGYAFDTLEGAKAALRRLVGSSAADSELIDVMRKDGAGRMPPDSPVAEEDIQLIESWIDQGAPGL